jgi:hypothetical protein
LSGIFPGDEAIERWRSRVGDALAEALEFLAGHEKSPFSDGVLGEWMRELVGQRLEERHLSSVETLLQRPDPHLIEAGLELAARALECFDCVDRLEPSLARIAREQRDEPWVLEALVDLLRRIGAEFVQVYGELAKPPPPRRRRDWPGINRNRMIQPEVELVTLFEQHLLRRLQPWARDELILPVLERKHGTKGWRDTQLAVLKQMGLDPDHHFRVLRGR